MIDRHEAVTRAYEIPGQTWPAELCWLYDNLQKSRQHAEIGVYCGRSLFTSCGAMSDGEVFAVDKDLPDCGVPVPDRTWLSAVQNATLQAIKSTNPGVRVKVRHDGSLAAAAELQLAGVRLDSVFIDGSHHYEHVIGDIQAWRALLRPGGLISGHDYWAADVGVMRAVNEVFGSDFKVVPDTRIWFARV